MDYLASPFIPGGLSAAIPGGTTMLIQGVQQHSPILTIIGLGVVGVGALVLGYLRRRQRQDARAAGL